jgi:hypothetical protein
MANKLKQNIKGLLRKLDEAQSSVIRLDAFLALLEAHQVRISRQAV